jgi:hypothetical protein
MEFIIKIDEEGCEDLRRHVGAGLYEVRLDEIAIA